MFSRRGFTLRESIICKARRILFFFCRVYCLRERSKSFSQNADSRTVVLLIQNAAIVTARIRKTIDRAEFALKFCSRIDYLRIKMVPIIPFCSCSSTISHALSTTHFYKNRIIFVEPRCSYSEMTKISNFAHTLQAFKMLFRMSTFIHNNSMIRKLASSWVTSPDGCKSEPSCFYKGCSYEKKCIFFTDNLHSISFHIECADREGFRQLITSFDFILFRVRWQRRFW